MAEVPVTTFNLHICDLQYGQLYAALSCSLQVSSLTSLTISSVILFDTHLSALAALTQIKQLSLKLVDVRAREEVMLTALTSLTGLQSFQFVEWNNPLLSIGNLVALTDHAVGRLAVAWQQLTSFTYHGKVSGASGRGPVTTLHPIVLLQSYEY